MNKLFYHLEKALYSLTANVSLFVFLMFMYGGVLTMAPLWWCREEMDLLFRYVLIPWGAALSFRALHLQLRRSGSAPRWDLRILLALFAWIVVPFALRFGMTADNVSSWYAAMAVYFGIYALLSCESPKRREKMIDWACALFALLSAGLGLALLYCVVTAQEFTGGFGVVNNKYLCAGAHYNGTGMRSLCCTLMCLWGAARSRRKPVLRAMYIVAAIIIGLTVILTQSRTARYSLLGALAVGAYGYICGLPSRKSLLRHAAGLLAAVLVAVGGYMASSAMTDAALAHYARVTNMRLSGQAMDKASDYAGLIAESVVPAALAQEEESAQADAAPTVAPKKNRGIGDATFTGRTAIWNNLLSIWKRDPKYFVIGCGIGRVGSEIVKGTLVEADGYASTHNTFLQYIADYGLIGFLLLMAAVGMIVPGALRLFFADNRRLRPGDRVPVMIIAAAVLTGMMESEPLSPLSPMNVVLFFALAALSSRVRRRL